MYGWRHRKRRTPNSKKEEKMRKLLVFIYAGALLTTASAGSAQTLTTLYDFTGSAGAYPDGLVHGPGGTLLGATTYGGAGNFGAVFQLSPPATAAGTWTENAIYSFTGKADGAVPGGVLVVGNAIYGTTLQGGNSFNSGCSKPGKIGCGIIFQLSPPATAGSPWTKTTVYTFAGGADGAAPTMLVPGVNGVLYGVTQNGGGSSKCVDLGNEVPGCGTVFQLTPPAAAGQAWTETVLHAFQGGSDSAFPESVQVLANGELIGPTLGIGGQDFGTVFALTPPAAPGGAWTKAVLHRFTGGSDGDGPVGKLIEGKNGQLYGTTLNGGLPGFGVVYELTRPAGAGLAWTEQVLYAFQGGSDGSYPSSGLTRGPNGAFFGTTGGTYSVSQGQYLDGTAFVLEPPSISGGLWTEKVLYLFAADLPAGLLMGGHQTLYGFTVNGGTSQNGEVFQLTY
jgi:uncharacterized repeat protein (TIGR03803 family)